MKAMPKTRNIGHTASGQSFHFCCTAFLIGLRSRTFVRVSSIDAVKEENKALVRRHERPYITVTLSHGALRPKPRHGVSVISELFEDFFSVGAEKRGGETGSGSPLARRNPARTTAISRSISHTTID